MFESYLLLHRSTQSLLFKAVLLRVGSVILLFYFEYSRVGSVILRFYFEYSRVFAFYFFKVFFHKFRHNFD